MLHYYYVCSIVHELNISIRSSKKMNFLQSTPNYLSNIAHPIEILDLENKPHATQTCICLNGPANSSVSLGNSSHCIQSKSN